MEIAKQIAGFSPAEADDLRKAIGKKIHSLMASLKGKFLEGCASNGVSPGAANQLWSDLEQAQDYSFNKSHAACYALIAYRTAWLRANHAKEYMAALISSVMNTKDKVPFYVAACHDLAIDVLPPDVNTSMIDFAVVEGKIRFGLNAVKNVGESACRAIVRAREEGGTVHVDLGLHRARRPADVNKRALESLVKCGALDSTGASRMRDARVSRAGARVGAEAAVRQAARARARSSTSASRRGDAAPRHHPTIARGRVREERAAEAREGDARALRLRPSADADPRPAAPQDRLRDQRDRAAARRRGRRRRRHRLVAEADDDEEGRPDGVRRARGRHRLVRGRRVQLGVRARARAARAGPGDHRQGPHRPEGRGGDEARRDRGHRLRGDARAQGGAAEGRRAHRAGGHHPRARRRS